MEDKSDKIFWYELPSLIHHFENHPITLIQLNMIPHRTNYTFEIRNDRDYNEVYEIHEIIKSKSKLKNHLNIVGSSSDCKLGFTKTQAINLKLIDE